MTGNNPNTFSVAALWGSIQRAVNERASTASLWQTIRSDAAANGQTLPQGSFQEVNRLRGLAAGLRNAGESLQRAAADAAIGPQMIGQTIYSRPFNQQALSPSFHIRYQVTGEVNGQTQSVWLSDVRSTFAGVTKQQLLDDLYTSALVAGSSGSSPLDSVFGVDAVIIASV